MLIFVLAIAAGIAIGVGGTAFLRVSNKLYEQCHLRLACVAGFILCGFQHCIADMFYFYIATASAIDTLLAVFVITVGDSIGGMFILGIKNYLKVV